MRFINEMISIEDIRSQFPQLEQKVYGKPLVYLDNAATSLRPRSVADKWTAMSLVNNSNLHRAVHHTATVATDEYESARLFVKDYLGASSSKEIIFTSGATASLNLVAYSYGEAFVNAGDNIIVSEAEHHSNLVPWQQMCKRRNAELRIIRVKEDGQLDLDSLESQIDSRTRLVCVAHISNVLGIVNPVRSIVDICHAHGSAVLIDGAQGIVHCNVNVAELGCDFYVFSGHKVFAAPGTGVLYGKKELLEQMPPFLTGGEMIGTVKWQETTWAPLPQKFEAGTQNISGTPTLVPALELAKELIINDIELNKIKDYVWNELDSNPLVTLYGNPEDRTAKIPLFSFSVKGAHHEDIALILDKMGVAVRSGQMCAEPLMDRFGVTGMVRASFGAYNTLQEAEYFIESLDRAVKMLL